MARAGHVRAGLFTGHLIQRFGTLRVMVAGVLLNLACVAIALTGLELERFLAALLLLGIGWNFLFTGATTLLTTTYQPHERTRAQGAMGLLRLQHHRRHLVRPGALVTTQGWFLLNPGSLVPLSMVALALAWLARRSRVPQKRSPGRMLPGVSR